MENSFIVTFIIYAIIQGIGAKPPSKIIGGENAIISEFPSTVSIRLINFGHICGGSIISDRHVLTAAHCAAQQKRSSRKYERVYSPNQLIIYAGSSSSSCSSLQYAHHLERVHLHPFYTGELGWRNDIAILTLKNPIVFNNLQCFIALPSKEPIIGETGYLVGWGYTREQVPRISESLNKAMMQVLDKKSCESYLGSLLFGDQLCGFIGNNVGFCDGDSGGPFIVNNEIVGVVSFSYGCARGYPDVYTNVFRYLDWINGIIYSGQ